MEGVEPLLRVSCLTAGCPNTCTTTGDISVFGEPYARPSHMPEGWEGRKGPVGVGQITGYWCPLCAGKRKIDGQASKTT